MEPRSPSRGFFVRESSGLVKSAGFMDAVSINVANMSVGAALGTVGFTLSALPSVVGVNLVVASIIAFLISIPQIVVYTMLTRLVPRTGGDYVWLTRALGPRFAWLAFGFAFGFVIESLTYYALISLAGVQQITEVMPVLGINLSLNDLETIILAVAFFAVIILANILGTRYGVRLMTALTVFSIIGLVASIAVFLVTPRPIAEARISALLPKGTTYASVASGYVGPSFMLWPTIMILPFYAIYIYPWLNAGPAMASEIRGRKAVNLNVPVAALISMVLATAAFAAMYTSLGLGFTNEALAQGYINYWTAAMILTPNTALRWLIGLSSITWYLAILAYGAITVVRYWFAMSFDRVLPEFLSYLSPRFGTPIYAHLLDLSISAVLTTLAELFYGTFTALYGVTVESLIYFMLVGIAASMLGLRLASYGRSRSILVSSGVLTAVVMGYLTYQFLAYPAIWGGNWLAYGVALGSVVLGIVIYEAAKLSMARSMGIAIEVNYLEIPPE